MMEFQGFTSEAVQLLGQLPQYDDKKYKAAKALLDDGLRKPGLALAESLGHDLTVSARSSVSPLHRDLRFAKAGTPRYKDHFMLTTWTGTDKKTALTLWLRLDASSIGFASGVMFTPEIRDRFREAVAGAAGAKLQGALDKIVAKHAKHHVQVAGDQLKKVPKGYDPEHPRADLLRRNGLQVRFREDYPASLTKAVFAGWVEKRLRDLLPVHEWLVKYVG